MGEALGGQTVTVVEQVRGQHNRQVDGATTTWPGCSVQPQGDGAGVLTSGRDQETRQWRLFAPAGFRASASAVCTVSPGPVDDQGEPARLAFVATAQPWPDEHGVEHHVEATLRLITTGG